MPIVKIIAKTEQQVIDLKKATEEISAETGISSEHLYLYLEYLSPSRFYSGSGNEYPMIHISARTANGKELIQKLMQAASKAVASQLNADASNLLVFAHPIEDGYLLTGGKIV